jgi:RNA polymerase II subunit A small phosphatase-like protein
MNNSEKILLILDLDEVLVYSTEDTSVIDYDFTIYDYRVRKRPFVDDFLKHVAGLFEVAVWTHATDGYAHIVIRKVFPSNMNLSFVWCRSRCTSRHDHERRDRYWVKDLKKVKRVGYNLERVLVIEDDPRTMQRSYGNLITVRPFYGDPEDKELQELKPYMSWISSVKNVRAIEKRTWSKNPR